MITVFDILAFTFDSFQLHLTFGLFLSKFCPKSEPNFIFLLVYQPLTVLHRLHSNSSSALCSFYRHTSLYTYTHTHRIHIFFSSCALLPSTFSLSMHDLSLYCASALSPFLFAAPRIHYKTKPLISFLMKQLSSVSYSF